MGKLLYIYYKNVWTEGYQVIRVCGAIKHGNTKNPE